MLRQRISRRQEAASSGIARAETVKLPVTRMPQLGTVRALESIVICVTFCCLCRVTWWMLCWPRFCQQKGGSRIAWRPLFVTRTYSSLIRNGMRPVAARADTGMPSGADHRTRAFQITPSVALSLSLPLCPASTTCDNLVPASWIQTGAVRVCTGSVRCTRNHPYSNHLQHNARPTTMTHLSFLAKVWQLILVIDEEGRYDRMQDDNEKKEQMVAVGREPQVPRDLVVLKCKTCAPRRLVYMVFHGLAPSTARCTGGSATSVSACIVSRNPSGASERLGYL